MFDVIAQDETFGFLETAMDLLSMRHSLIAGNIANADTPGYRAVELQFKRELHVAFERQRGAEMRGFTGAKLRYEQVLRPRVAEVGGSSHRLDGNTVNLEREMIQLARTTAIYNQAARMMSIKLRMLKAAIKQE